MLNIGRQPLGLPKWFHPFAQQPMETYDPLLFKLDKLPKGSESHEIDMLFTCCLRVKKRVYLNCTAFHNSGHLSTEYFFFLNVLFVYSYIVSY